MAPKTGPKTKRKKQKHPARIVPSMLDEMEAMVRHPKFRSSLPLWRNIFGMNYVGLTEEEERARDAPRPKFRVAAILEADRQWLSRSIRDLRTRGEAMWAFDAVKGPFGDRTDTVNPLIPCDLSLEAIQQWVGELVSQQRKTSGVKPIQNPRAPAVDSWNVYDRMQEKNATPATVRDSLYGPYGRVDRRFSSRQRRLSPQDKLDVKRDLKRITNAYRHAKAMMKRLDSPLK
jgi:hypothetical protein